MICNDQLVQINSAGTEITAMVNNSAVKALVNTERDKYELWEEDDAGNEVMIANFIPAICQELQTIYVDQKVSYMLEIELRHGKSPFKKIQCRISDLGKKDFYYKAFGISQRIWYMPLTEEKIKHFMLESAKDIQTKKKYQFWGRMGNERLFVSDQLGVIEPIENMNALPIESFINYILETLFKIILPNEKTMMLFSVAILAPMISSIISKGLEKPAFSVLLEAKTGSRKTTISSLIFHLDEHGKAPLSFESTFAFILEKLNEMRDHSVVVDDLHPFSSVQEKAEQRKKLEAVTRSSGDLGSARQKIRNNTAISASSEAIPVITAEYCPPMPQSSYVRLLHIKYENTDVDLKKLTLAQNNIDLYRAFYKAYISWWLCEEGVIEDMCERYEEYRRMLLSEFSVLHPRTCSNYAWIKASFETFCSFSKKYNPKKEEDIQANLLLYDNSIKAALLEEVKVRDCERGIKRYLDIITELKELNKVDFARLWDKKTATISKIKNNTVLMYDDSYVYFRTDLMAEYINSFASKRESIEAVTGRRLRQMLSDEECIFTSCNGKTLLTESKCINRKKYRVTKVRRSILKEKYEFEVLV